MATWLHVIVLVLLSCAALIVFGASLMFFAMGLGCFSSEVQNKKASTGEYNTVNAANSVNLR